MNNKKAVPVNPSASFQESTEIIRVLVCSYPGIFADVVINELDHNATIKVVGLVYSQRIFSAQETWLGSALRMINTSGFSYAILQFVQTDFYRFLRRLFLIKQIEKTVPLLRTKNINTESGLAFLKDLKPDIILLANFNQKVSEHVISVPTLGCLNIHPSALPRFKGVDPVFMAMYGDEHSLGVTVHKVDENFDTGAILDQALMTVEEGRSVFYHQLQLFRQGVKLAANTIKHSAHGNLKYIENVGGNYDSWPSKAKIKEFKHRGGRLIRCAEYLTALKEEFSRR